MTQLKKELLYIKEIETATGIKLEELQPKDFAEKEFKDTVSKDVVKRGYLIENGVVTGLKLEGLRKYDPEIIQKFENLQTLSLTQTFFDDYSFIKKIKNLKKLYIAGLRLSDNNFLKELKSLQSLDLSYNQISDYGFLKELRSLQSLDLSYNQISDISFLKDLKSLRSLDLSYNQISDISFLKELSSLQSLDLSNNNIYDIGVLKYLDVIKSLNLSCNKISDTNFIDNFKLSELFDEKDNLSINYSFLKNLSSLQLLDISYNKISDISFLKELKSLKSLSLSNNKISEISSLKKLKSLRLLNLSNNEIINFKVLENLNTLQSLDLSSCQIDNIPFSNDGMSLKNLNLSDNKISNYSFLKKNKMLESLNLSNNKISDCSFFQEIEMLKSLDLSNNKINDISFLEGLKYIKNLNLSNNKISDCSSLKKLETLKSLDLSNNKINDISFLEGLKFIENLNLSNNDIDKINIHKCLILLQSLDLRFNKISEISFLKDIKSLKNLKLNNILLYGMRYQISEYSVLKELILLESLDLSDNQIQDYSFLKNLNGLRKIKFDNNNIKTIPPEILKDGLKAIFDYFDDLEIGETRKLNEVKVLLIGDGGSGKTSLLKQLLNKNFNPNEPQTHGINIEHLNTKIDGEEAKIHVWDFGGQEIMHATHQFFLSKRAVYILVLDSRKDEKTEYWLKHIRSFGGDSKVIVALNKIDESPSFEVNRADLLRKYPQIYTFVRISCAKRWGIEELKDHLFNLIPTVDLYRMKWPYNWYKVKETLEDEDEHYINIERYTEICKISKVEKRRQNTLLDYLHNLGVVLYFDKLHLRNYQVLKPHWVTEAVYKIVNSKLLAETQGYLIPDDAEYILNKEEFNKTEYQSELKQHNFTGLEIEYIIELMKEFELCYEIDNSNKYLVPDLLKVEEPEEIKDFKTENTLRFIYQFDFLPPSLLPRFIVKMHDIIKDEKLQWRTGVVLYDENTKSEAIIKTDKEAKTLSICINGENKRKFFSDVTGTINRITKNKNISDTKSIFSLLDSFEKLEYKEFIPVSAKDSVGAQNFEPQKEEVLIEYSELLGLEKMGEEFITVGKLGKKFNVLELLEGIEDEKARDIRRKFNQDKMGVKEVIAELKKIAEDEEEKKKKEKDRKYMRVGVIAAILAIPIAIFFGIQSINADKNDTTPDYKIEKTDTLKHKPDTLANKKGIEKNGRKK